MRVHLGVLSLQNSRPGLRSWDIEHVEEEKETPCNKTCIPWDHYGIARWKGLHCNDLTISYYSRFFNPSNIFAKSQFKASLLSSNLTCLKDNYFKIHQTQLAIWLFIKCFVNLRHVVLELVWFTNFPARDDVLFITKHRVVMITADSRYHFKLTYIISMDRNVNFRSNGKAN